jgi:hypothetical protein
MDAVLGGKLRGQVRGGIAHDAHPQLRLGERHETQLKKPYQLPEDLPVGGWQAIQQLPHRRTALGLLQ